MSSSPDYHRPKVVSRRSSVTWQQPWLMPRDVLVHDVMIRDVSVHDVMMRDVLLHDVMSRDVLVRDVMSRDVLIHDVIMRDVIYVAAWCPRFIQRHSSAERPQWAGAQQVRKPVSRQHQSSVDEVMVYMDGVVRIAASRLESR